MQKGDTARKSKKSSSHIFSNIILKDKPGNLAKSKKANWRISKYPMWKNSKYSEYIHHPQGDGI